MSEELLPIVANCLGNVFSTVPLYQKLYPSSGSLSINWQKANSFYYYFDQVVDFPEIANPDHIAFTIDDFYVNIFWDSSVNKNFQLRLDKSESSYDQPNSQLKLKFISNVDRDLQQPSNNLNIKFNVMLVSDKIQQQLKGQRAVGVNNVNCLKLGTVVNNKKVYISRIAYVDNSKNISYISRRLVERVINPYGSYSSQVSNTNQNNQQYPSSTGETQYTLNVGSDINNIWMGWITYESGDKYGTSGAVFDVGDHKRAYGTFNFDITSAGGNGRSDLLPFMREVRALGYEYFSEFDGVDRLNGDDQTVREKVSKVFKDVKDNVESLGEEEQKEILEKFTQIQTVYAAKAYLTNKSGVKAKASEYGFNFARYSSLDEQGKYAIGALVGAMWSFSNRNGAGSHFNRSIKAMAEEQRRQINQHGSNDITVSEVEEILKAGYKVQYDIHTSYGEHPRWNPNGTNYESECYCAIQYVNREVRDLYNTSVNPSDLSLSVSSSADVGFSHIINAPLVLSQSVTQNSDNKYVSTFVNQAHDFGFFGDKEFLIDLNIYSVDLPNIQQEGIRAEDCFVANVVYNGKTPEDSIIPSTKQEFLDAFESSTAAYQLYLKNSNGNYGEIWFKFTDGQSYKKYINTNIRLYNSSSDSNYKKLNIKVKKLYNASDKSMRFLFYSGDELKNKSDKIPFDRGFIIHPDSTRQLILGGFVDSNYLQKSINFYDRITLHGVSPRNDIVNKFYKNLSLGFTSGSPIESDV